MRPRELVGVVVRNTSTGPGGGGRIAGATLRLFEAGLVRDEDLGVEVQVARRGEEERREAFRVGARWLVTLEPDER